MKPKRERRRCGRETTLCWRPRLGGAARGAQGSSRGERTKDIKGTRAARQDGPTSGPWAGGGGVGSRSQDKAAAARTAPPRGPARPRRTRPASKHASESTRADDGLRPGESPGEEDVISSIEQRKWRPHRSCRHSRCCRLEDWETFPKMADSEDAGAGRGGAGRGVRPQRPSAAGRGSGADSPHGGCAGARGTREREGRIRRSCDVGVGGFIVVTLGCWFHCRYNYAKLRIQERLAREGIKNKILYESTHLDPARKQTNGGGSSN
ncbi:cytochrome c oxidase assembly protein COX20, mitochondrial isoform X1 [Muntiacus reevesi]|uniref:cytochrome c oxidase assembly protein COX20, mitochondrial isoform X1 n=1 Tax=Muntiacus reevesi TaxID=9886 RepID=UPI00330703C6